MKRAIIIILWGVYGSLYSQGIRLDSTMNQTRGFQPGKINYSLSLGSEFSSFSGSGSGFSSWITPSVSYNVNKRLKLGGGISVINSNYFNVRPWFASESTDSRSGNFTNAAIFVNGEYLVNDRLSVFGSAFKVFPVTKEPLPYNPFNPISAKGAQGVDLNIGYRIGRNFYIQAGFRYSDGLSPYQSDPFSRDPFKHGFSFPGTGLPYP